MAEYYTLTIDNNAPCLKFVWNDKSRGRPSVGEPWIKPLEKDYESKLKAIYEIDHVWILYRLTHFLTHPGTKSSIFSRFVLNTGM